MRRKYPKTPYWPWSPAINREDSTHHKPERFVDVPVVVTEKLDGGNTLLHNGEVYARSVSAPSRGKWMAMVRKHHAWKLTSPDTYLYGEDIYGLHSIAYGPVPENRTFYAFAFCNASSDFASFTTVQRLAAKLDIATVPILFEGCFRSVAEIRDFIEQSHTEPSVLGGKREGIVLRTIAGFSYSDFADNVCKSVRANHVQTDRRWRQIWKPCQIL